MCGSEVESCKVAIGSVAVVFLPSNSDVSPRVSPHNPPHPRMERDLLSCKHIGSSIENGLTKSIKADIIPVSGGGEGEEEEEGRYPPFPLCSSLAPPLLSFLLVCHLYPLFLLSLFFESLFPHPLFTLLCTPLFSLCLFFISCVGQWTARAMALTDLPAGLLRAALSSGLWRKKPPALKQLCRPGSERTMKNTEKKEGKFNGPLGIIPPHASLFFSFPLSLYLYCPLFFFISFSLVHDLTKFCCF